ncbi:hypothetical protein KIH74_28945 [Kineosporia sp. J2-2]|uniref:Uncharacterized protein n=1 Tax=Kineosporia corallincola TaxID=2835133 RepID=A0ABS5TPS2_9ACTN|nr:hypothetical protein [Kineosporia corallincola]MBT0773005.1 hypothetical protein [Kineosporia corallincola]
MSESSPSIEQIEQAIAVLGAVRPEDLDPNFVYRLRAWHEQEVLRLEVKQKAQGYDWFAELN